MIKRLFQDPKKKKIIGSILIFFSIIIILFIFGIFKKPCFDDLCFQKAVEKCIPAEIAKQKENNLYRYAIFPSIGERCNIQIMLERIAPGSDQELVRLLEKKSMWCEIPRKTLQETDLENVENMLQYCHGELKEGILQLIIQKMYTVIIGNLDEIVKESQKK